MDGDGSPDTSVMPISDKTLVLVTAVVSLLIFSGIIAAYPHGLHLSPSVALTYQGTNETFFAGKLHINGSINGTLAIHNTTQIRFSLVDEVRIVDSFHDEHTFTTTALTVASGDCTINGSGLMNTTLSSALAAYNASSTSQLLVLTDEVVSWHYRGVITIIVHNGEITIGNVTWHGKGAYYLTVIPHSWMMATAQEFILATREMVTLHCDAAPSYDDIFLDRYNITLPPLPFSLNGIVGVLDQPSTENWKTKTAANITLLRGTGTAVIHNQITVDASGPLLIQNGKFFTQEQPSFIWFIPANIIGLWPVAVAVLIAGALIRKKWPGYFEDRYLSLGGVGIIIHVLMLGVAAFLWDREVQYVFGKSILAALQSLAQGGTSGLEAWIVGPFELIPWLAALVLIGLPVRIFLVAIFKIIGIGPLGNEVGKGTGALLTSLSGATYIAFFLNITLAPIIESFLG
jgi:hypothetical protein